MFKSSTVYSQSFHRFVYNSDYRNPFFTGVSRQANSKQSNARCITCNVSNIWQGNLNHPRTCLEYRTKGKEYTFRRNYKLWSTRAYAICFVCSKFSEKIVENAYRKAFHSARTQRPEPDLC